MSEGSRWLLSVALYALAVMLMAPAAYGAVGLYFLIWGVPWPSQDWALVQLGATWVSAMFGLLAGIKARELSL